MLTPQELLPHQDPMILISAIKQIDMENHALTSTVTISDKDMFFDKSINGVPVFVALEYMAQTIACLVGAYDRQKNQKPKIGFVLGSRKIKTSISHFNNKESYDISVKEIFCDDSLASFDCSMYDSQQTLIAQAIVNAYRPTDINDFMKGYQ